MVTITIIRDLRTAVCTMGVFEAVSDKKKGKVTGYTLEPPWRENRPFESCIPPGVYKGFKRIKGTGKWDYDVIELLEVPGRKNIQLHAGNYPKNTTGCVLLGSERGVNAVWQSKIKVRELIDFCEGEDIQVVIKEVV